MMQKIINDQVKSNYAQFLRAFEGIKSVLELVKTFTDTCLSLDAYNRDELKINKIVKRKL